MSEVLRIGARFLIVLSFLVVYAVVFFKELFTYLLVNAWIHKGVIFATTILFSLGALLSAGMFYGLMYLAWG